MRRFLRRSAIGPEALPVAMSGARMGERLLQIGLDDPRVASAIAAKPGLSGESAMVVADEGAAVAAGRAVSDTGSLVTIRVHPLDSLPFDEGAFDVTVVHDRADAMAGLENLRARVLAECRRVLRPGGRLVLLGRGTSTGLVAALRPRPEEAPAEATIRDLETAGFRGVRLLGDRDGYRFFEGMKPGGGPSDRDG
jgi:SAM-dependent methyltransferase